MAEVRCPMCGKLNPPDLEVCQHCEARLVPLASGSPGESPTSQDQPDEQPASGGGWLDDLRGDEAEPDVSPTESEEPEQDSDDWLGRLDSEDPLWASEANADDAEAGAAAFQEPESEDHETHDIPGMSFASEDEPAAEEDVPDWLKSIEIEPPEGIETQEIPGMAFKTPEEPAEEDSADGLADPPEDFSTIEIPGLAMQPPEEDLSEPGAEPGELPEWLTEDVPKAEPGDVPEWLSEDAPAEEQPTLPPVEEPVESSDVPEAVPGDLPDWLSEEVPAEDQPVAPSPEEPAEAADLPEAEPGELPDWLSDKAPEAAAAAALAAGVEPGEDAELTEAMAGGLPDWLSDETPAEEQPILPPVDETIEPAEDADPIATESPEPSDWLSDEDVPEEAAAAAIIPAEEPDAPADLTEAEPGELPDWLSDRAPEAAAAAALAAGVEPGEDAELTEAMAGGLPDWLSDETPAEEQPILPPVDEPIEPAEDADPMATESVEPPDWLSDEDVPEEAAATAIIPGEEPDEAADLPEAEPGDLPDWLSDEGAGTDSEELPDWISAEAAAVGAAAAAIDEPDAEEIEDPGIISEEEGDQPPAEVEAEEGELPDWLKAGAAAAAAGVVAGVLKDDDDEPAGEEPAVSSDEQEELPDWLQGEVEAESWELEQDAVPASELEILAPFAAGDEPAEDIEPITPGSLEEETEDWLAVGEVPTEADLPLSLEDEDVPDWLKSLQATQQEAAEGATVEEIEGLEPTVDDPAEMVEEGEIPNWLEDLSFAVPAVAVEAEGGEEIPAAEAPADTDEGQSPTSQGGDVEPILPGVLQDAFDDSEDMEITPSEGDEELEPADLPGWLKAMRPVEAVAAVSPFIEEGDPGQVIEGVGPLAGLQGVLPAEPDITQAGSSSMVSTRVDVTKNQYDHVGMLKTIVLEEAEPQEFGDKRSLIQPGHILRWIIAVALIAILALPLLTGGSGISQPTIVPDETLAANQVIASQQTGDKVLVAFDYQPGTSGEMDAVADAVFQDLLSRQVLLTIVSTNTTGPALAEVFLGDNGPGGDFAYTHGENYLNLGYIPGGAVGLQFFATNPQQTLEFPFNLSGLPDPYSAWSAPPLQGITTLSDYSMALVLTDDASVARAWVEQVGIHLEATPLVMVASGQAAPLIRPYYETNPRQVDGLVSGLVGGISYEQHTGTGMLAGTYWDAYNNGIIIAIVLIIAGGLYGTVASLIRRIREDSEPKSESTDAEPEEET